MFAEAAIALYVAHHVGDYWVQTDHQAQHKGDAGLDGALQCLLHVFTYVLTQAVLLYVVMLVIGEQWGYTTSIGLAISGVTHYLADRREHGIMFRLARLLPGKARFLELGKPYMRLVIGTDGQIIGKVEGNPTLGTGAWALDQAWHIFWGVFVAALMISI